MASPALDLATPNTILFQRVKLAINAKILNSRPERRETSFAQTAVRAAAEPLPSYFGQ
jgi:hypothetical protein